MSRIAFRSGTQSDGDKRQGESLGTSNLVSEEKNADLKQLKAVLALYTVLVDVLFKMRACLLDQRMSELAPLRSQCLDILQTLQNGLEQQGELSENLHLLYGHCVKRLTSDKTAYDIESLDAVRMVITRLQHVYHHLEQKVES